MGHIRQTVFHCNYVSTLHRFRDIITYFPKFIDVTLRELDSTPFHVLLSVNQHRKFKVPSFTDSKDMIGTKILKNGSCDSDYDQ